jgi:hypothetical protein
VIERIPLLSTAALVATVASSGAYAQANRTFVSGHGGDSNPCSIAALCRSFAGAIAQTNAGGEVAVVDTAGYGAVTIIRAVSIVNEEGVEAGITVAQRADARPGRRWGCVKRRAATPGGAGGTAAPSTHQGPPQRLKADGRPGSSLPPASRYPAAAQKLKSAGISTQPARVCAERADKRAAMNLENM